MDIKVRPDGSQFRVWVDGRPTAGVAATEREAWDTARRTLARLGLDLDEVVTAPRPAAAPRPAVGSPVPVRAAAPAAASRVHFTPSSSHAPAAISLSVMLAETWKNEDPTGWWWSNKLNGVRAYWDGRGMYTRNGNRIDLPHEFERYLPPGVALDGELWVGRAPNALQEMVSIKARATDPRWQKVKFMVFDAPNVPGGCEARWQVARSHARGPIEFVEQVRVQNRAHLDRLLAAELALGGEGGMLRYPNSSYERRRSSRLLKVKKTESAEAVIIGYTPGQGRHAGRLGAYQCRFVHNRITFDVGTGLTDKDRNRPLPIGTVITVSWKMLTPDGKPHPASFEGARDYE